MADHFDLTDHSPTGCGDDGGVPMPALMADGLRREWGRLGSPGTWWTGEERVAIAQVARDSLTSDDAPTHPNLPAAALDAAARVAAEPTSLSAELVARYEAEGLSAAAYTEIVGVVARLVAVDTTVRGIGGPVEPLPSPAPGDPSHETSPKAKKRSAWVPMVGAAGAVTALSGVPAEDAAQRDLHGVLYLTYEEMGDLEIVKGLTRAQLEVVAAKTSILNHCVY